MVTLIPMTEEEYPDFIKFASNTFKNDQIKAGNWSPEEAEARMLATEQALLPKGLKTPNHYFWKLIETDTEANLGNLWVAVMEREGSRFLFVFFVHIKEEYRRRGYASQAFLRLEDKARELGINTIMLNVFEHNTGAREMYQGLGYSGTITELSKTFNC